MAALFACALVVIMGFLGLAVDYNHASGVKANMQATLDAAVLAAASSTNTPTTIAENYFNAAKFNAQSVNATFSVTGNKVTGTATATVNTSFLKVLNLNKFDIKVESTATGGGSAASPLCIMALGNKWNSTTKTWTTGKMSSALNVNSGPAIEAGKCEIHVLSTAGGAAMFNAGASLNFSKICIASTSINDNSNGAIKNIKTSCATNSDPYAGKLTSPKVETCIRALKPYEGGTVDFEPGTYCGAFNLNSKNGVGVKATFKPGVYVFSNSSWVVDGGTWTGDGVTFYFDDDKSSIQFNSGMTLNIAAPTSASAAYPGVLMFERAGLNKSSLTFNDSNSSTLSGVIYLPSRDVTFNSTSNITATRSFQLIVNSLMLNAANWTIAPYSTSGGGSGNARLTN